jgi:uncharacterized protein YprB with RNaseH-like and TPR domain
VRDLTSRLREIVRREAQRPAIAEPISGRELTFVPEEALSAPSPPAAEALGGVPLDARGACVIVERRYPADRTHGRQSIGACAPTASAPIRLFDPRLAAADDWWRRVVFFDIETSGLSGGAGTLAFLVGCGWFTEDGFVVRQFFLAGPSGEGPMLEALARVFDEASLVVTYNGRTFDVPLMETRWAFHRREAPTADLPHFDMLPPARRLWARRDRAASLDEAGGCSLTAIERRVLRFHRGADVPGFEIPARYFHFLRYGDPAVIEGVLEHNRHDLVSLAAVMARAMWLAREGPEACGDATELVGLGRLYVQAGDVALAERAFRLAASAGDSEERSHALARLAELLSQQRRHDEAAAAWHSVLAEGRRAPDRQPALRRRAAEALAIHHEHRARDLRSAHRYASTLNGGGSRRQQQDFERRLARLRRKMRDAGGGRPLRFDE